MLCMYTNMEEVQPYFDKFDKTYWKSREQPTMQQLDHMREHGIKGSPSLAKWFRTYVIYLFPPFSFLILVQISFYFLKLLLFSI
jgi:hypothetical protein